jgi:hypothetical protein
LLVFLDHCVPDSCADVFKKYGHKIIYLREWLPTVVLNILARQRYPDPPATIRTPAALTLRHAPVADCARYDNLRRTN